jgi:predicted DsbA family dithiol-disulfide isomerase
MSKLRTRCVLQHVQTISEVQHTEIDIYLPYVCSFCLQTSFTMASLGKVRPAAKVAEEAWEVKEA